MSANNSPLAAPRVLKGSPPTSLQAVIFSTMNVDLVVETSRKVDCVDLTDEVESAVVQSGVSEGMVTVFVLHTTAALGITEWQRELMDDIEGWFELPVRRQFLREHNDRAQNDRERSNDDSQFLGLLFGPSVTLPIRNRKLLRSARQNVALIEFDGPQSRNLVIQVLGA